MPPLYPLLLDVSPHRIVIVGGGPVGLRKAVKLIEAGATDVTVVSPVFVDGFPPGVKKLTAAFQPEHLIGATLVFAATDSPAVNSQVAAEAHRQRASVNRADEETGDFTLPASIRDGPITVGVWSDHPSLSAAIRDRLHDHWDHRWPAMAQALDTLRPMILNSGLPIQRRRLIFRELATEAALKILADGGMQALTEWVAAKLRVSGDHPPANSVG